jgi:phosphoribosyl 1,2-cyclic phosphate phosphodiesterase
MRVTVLGCGTSAGVPQIGCDCPVCRSPDPRNKRRRCSILVEAQGQRILVDTGPDLRQQCLDAGIGAIDALLYTHAHADHVHGIDDLRSINNVIMAPIPAYADARVFESIRERFPYVFVGGQGRHGFWRPGDRPAPDHRPVPDRPGRGRAVRQKHGRGESWGFRFGPFAYSTDTTASTRRRSRPCAASRSGSSTRCATPPTRATPTST